MPCFESHSDGNLRALAGDEVDSLTDLRSETDLSRLLDRLVRRKLHQVLFHFCPSGSMLSPISAPTTAPATARAGPPRAPASPPRAPAAQRFPFLIRSLRFLDKGAFERPFQLRAVRDVSFPFCRLQVMCAGKRLQIRSDPP